MQKLLIGLLLLACTMVAMAQKRKLPPTISSWSNNEYAPKLTADGRSMLYMSDQTVSGGPEIFSSTAVGSSWSKGELMDIPHKNMIPFGAYNLSYDGQQLIYSSKKSPGIGGYDLRFQQKQGGSWTQPVNPGKPLNSNLHEMDPTLSADGKTLYFSRCETLDPNGGNCKLFTAEFLGDVYWKEPQEIQLDLVSSSFVSPVILPDNKTLYFAALNSNGNYDMYMSRKEGTSWSKPIAMDFLNNDTHNRYIGVTALGDVAYIHEKGERSYDLYMVKVPEEFQPAKVYYLEGTVTNLPAKSLVSATDAVTGEVLARLVLDTEEKTFGIYLPEDHLVDFSVETKESGFAYYSEFLDLTELKSSKKVVKDIALPTLRRGAQYPVDITFKEHSADFGVGTEAELNRLITLMKQNRDYQFNIAVSQPSVTESEQYADSLPDIRYDTVLVKNQLDTHSGNDSINVEPDSAVVALAPAEEILTIYHNNFTQKRAAAISAYFLEKGVPESMFSTTAEGKNVDFDYSESDKQQNYKVVFYLE